MSILLPAILLGFLGSFHCIGMCGPIALILPVQHLTGLKKVAGILLYNTGRITAYTMMGMIFGWMGRWFYLGGMQQWLSIIVGSLLLSTVIFHRLLPSPDLRFIRNILGRLLARRRFSTLYAIGFFNGFLPCGFVYMAVAGALASGDIWQGMLFMGGFGAGTLPAMAAVTWFSQLISLNVRQRIRKLVPYMVGAMAVLLILRGMNLGIPYISPVITAHETISCHKPS